jgi:ABC-2 type transport system permease protein
MKTILIATLGEVRKGLFVQWAYKVNLLAGFVTLAFAFILISFIMGGGRLDPEQTPSMLLGFLGYSYALFAISDLSGGIGREISAGTLEQMCMSPAPLGLVLLGRTLANLIVATVQVLPILGVLLLFDIRLPTRWEGLPVFMILLVGVYGFGFIIAGATLVLKQAGAFATLIQNALFFLNGTVLAVDAMPSWLAFIAKTLPTTQGIIVLRQVVLEGYPLAYVWEDRSLAWLIVHSASYFAVGWLVFNFCYRITLKRGSLGQY